METQGLIERVWQERHISLLLITHDVEEAVALADRVLVKAYGRFILEISVPLSRPRNRSDREFLQLKDQLLRRVLGTDQPEAGIA